MSFRNDLKGVLAEFHITDHTDCKPECMGHQLLNEAIEAAIDLFLALPSINPKYTVKELEKLNTSVPSPLLEWAMHEAIGAWGVIEAIRNEVKQ